MTAYDFMMVCFGISALIFGAALLVGEVRRRRYWREYNERKRNDDV